MKEIKYGKKKTIVFSGINLFEGGPLSIYYDCLDAIVRSSILKICHIVAFVHKKELFIKYKDIVELIELPKSRENYLYRLYYEYCYFYKFSKINNIDVWISLHDITPKVNARKLYTYCHNPSPFLKKDLKKIKYSWRVVAFSYFYRYLYRINIKSADAIIVQQDWMRQKFKQMYPVNEVIVARPTNIDSKGFECENNNNNASDRPSFIYPAYPRFFKNHEIILKACELLEKDGYTDFEIWLTIDGSENKYSKLLKQKYEHLHTIKWYGLLTRDELFEKYRNSWYLIFPSTLETWGLPISEYKMTKRPMFLAELPYAHETVGSYSQVVFFDIQNDQELANLIRRCLIGENIFYGSKESRIDKPYFENWDELLQVITEI